MANRRDVMGQLAVAASLPMFLRDAQATEHPVAMTQYGPVRGFRENNVLVFKGVRYGADTALTRFAKPMPPTPWTDIQDVFSYGPSSPQGGHGPMSEDCLFLNVWTPALADQAKRPIMVYFHGGAYAAGSGSAPLYDGKNLVTTGDVVVVTVNHRLNAFGYLSLQRLSSEYPDSGNAGMWDLVLALKWVRDNAVAFGGDPNRIFVFGQSGGGAKIATLMAAPAAKGLFHSAATMSGQQVTACGPLNGEERAKAFLDTLKIPSDNLSALQSMPMQKLLEGLSTQDPINSEHKLYFGPVLDGRLLSRHPFWPDAPEQSSHIPMILGNTHDETRNLIGRREPDSFSLDWHDLPPRLAHHMRCDIDPVEVIATYRATYPDYTPADVFFAATTAGRSWRGQVEEADVRARQEGPTWVYQFDYGSPEDGGKWGAPHGIDIAFAFNNLEKSGEIPGTVVPRNGVSDRIARELSGAFIAMARSGAPDHKGLSGWAKHRIPNRETLVFGQKSQLINDPRKAERALFAKVPFVQWGT